MSKFLQRSVAPEIMDDLACSGEVVSQTLRELDFINRWLGNEITVKGIENLLSIKTHHNKIIRVADIGCGSGDMLKLFLPILKRKFDSVALLGIDANPNIISYATVNCKSFQEITFKTENIFSDTFQQENYDLVTATLFLHHFTSEELIKFLRALKQQVRIGIVINDLHRHAFAYYSIKVLTAIFSKSSMVKFDAPLSVLRGFKRKEWVSILEKAGIKKYTLKWKWAFRWQLIIPASD